MIAAAAGRCVVAPRAELSARRLVHQLFDLSAVTAAARAPSGGTAAYLRARVAADRIVPAHHGGSAGRSLAAPSIGDREGAAARSDAWSASRRNSMTAAHQFPRARSLSSGSPVVSLAPMTSAISGAS